MSLLNKSAIAGILLAAGCPVLLWASTLSARVECRVDTTAKAVTPIGYRPESFPFLLMLAAAQGYGAWALLKGQGHQTAALAGADTPDALPASEAVEFVAPSQPEPVMLNVNATLETTTTPAPVPVVNLTQDIDSYDVATDLGGDRAARRFPQNVLILGTPGAGKGIVMSNAVRALKRQFPELMIFGIDPKAEPSEDGLWATGADSFTQVVRRPILGLSPDEVAQWVGGAIATYLRVPKNQPSLLVVDELNALQVSLNSLDKNSEYKPVASWLNSYLAHLISLGDASGKWFWGIAQSGTDKALPFDTTIRNNLRTVALVNLDNIGAVQGLLRTDVIAANQRDIKLVEAAVKKSPVKRAFYDRKTNRWHPQIPLKNYGEDRNPFAVSGVSESVSHAVAAETPETLPETAETPDPSTLRSNVIPLFQVSEIPSETAEIDPERRDRVLRMKLDGLSKTQIIKLEWGAKPGGSEQYKIANTEYEIIVQTAEAEVN